MRLLIIGGPMMKISGLDESGRIRRRSVECAVLAIQARQVAPSVINPLAGFGGREPQNHLAAAVPISGHQISMEVRRPEFSMKLHARIRIRMRPEVRRG